MSTQKLSNIKLKDFRDFLKKFGMICVSSAGGHEKWTKKNLRRPIILQTHIEPIPEFIVKNALRDLGITKTEFFKIWLDHDLTNEDDDDMEVDVKDI